MSTPDALRKEVKTPGSGHFHFLMGGSGPPHCSGCGNCLKKKNYICPLGPNRFRYIHPTP